MNYTLMLKWINVKNSINHFVQHTWFGTLCRMSTFTIFLKTNTFFSWWRKFLTGIWKFLLIYFCVGAVPINDCAPGEVKLWLFFLVFQIIEHHCQHQHFKLNIDRFSIFWIFFFNGVIRFVIYTISASIWHIVIGWRVNCHINVFITCVVTKWNKDRECKNISIHVSLPSILFAKFVNSADSVGHNGTSNIFCQMLKWWDLDDIFNCFW